MTKPGRHFWWLKRWYRIRRSSNSFLGSQWAGGVVLVIFAVIAIILANWGATKEWYHYVLSSKVGFVFNDAAFKMSVEHWINDGLMVLFFFVVGLEIKREIIAGELSNIKKASLPVVAAVGGMLVPAFIYLSINAGTEFEAGWGIPMATDIAFAIGILSLLGKRVPMALKIFLTALAIVDDLGAILVIAVFYTSSINFVMLGSGIVLLLLLYLMNRQGVTSVFLYVVPAIAIWYLFLNSGVHATIAGVLVAMMMPVRARFSKKYFSYKVRYFLEDFKMHDRDGVEVLSNRHQLEDLARVKYIANSAISPAQRLEHVLNPFVTFVVMPVFALANAGVEIVDMAEMNILGNAQGQGIFLGLVLGKPLGIFLFCWAAIKLRVAVMPQGGTWGSLLGVACLGGIGFTMSIFIANLAFGGTGYVDPAKIAILVASVSAAILGALVLNIVSQRPISVLKRGV